MEQIKSGRVDVPSFTIEHILPDSQDRGNALIGNLMPLEENLNGLCKDKRLNEKIYTYDRSNFSTARNVANRYRENVDDFNINTRSNAMADELYDEISRILNAL